MHDFYISYFCKMDDRDNFFGTCLRITQFFGEVQHVIENHMQKKLWAAFIM